MPDTPSVNDEGDSNVEFEDDALTRRHARRVTGIVRRAVPALLLTALLLLVAGRPNLALLFHRSPSSTPAPITVVCDVPWAIIRVDGRGPAAHCTPGVAGALPMARLSAPAGQHTLLATAEGFAPYPIYAVIHPQTPAIYLTQFALSPQGAFQALAAVNVYLASAYTQDAVFPVTFWRTLGLRAPPTGPELLVHERFEAIALDSYEPFYTETTYQRPIAPQPGTVGVAVVMVEHVTVSDGCDAAPLLERRLPLLFTTRASVTFSAHPGPHAWVATAPYALNPAAEITTAAADAAAPASPAGLLALTARTAMAAQPGDSGRLSSEVTTTPLVSAGDWAAGLALTLRGGVDAGAVWLYIAGRLTALTPTAARLTPHLLATTPATTLGTLRASLAHQPAQMCGGA